LPDCASQVLGRGAQAAARGTAQVLDHGAQAVARCATLCASQVLDGNAQAAARGAAQVLDHNSQADARGAACCRCRYLIVLPRSLPAAPLAVRRRYLMMVLRPVPAAPFIVRCRFLIVAPKLQVLDRRPGRPARRRHCRAACRRGLPASSSRCRFQVVSLGSASLKAAAKPSAFLYGHSPRMCSPMASRVKAFICFEFSSRCPRSSRRLAAGRCAAILIPARGPTTRALKAVVCRSPVQRAARRAMDRSVSTAMCSTFLCLPAGRQRNVQRQGSV